VVKFLFFLLISMFNIAHGTELKTITSEDFMAENPSSDRKIIVDSVTEQFKNKSVTQAQLDEVWNNLEERLMLKMARFQIVDQKLYSSTINPNLSHFAIIENYLKEFLKHYKLKDVDFIIHARDEIPNDLNLSEKILSVPAFRMSNDTEFLYEKNTLLLPDAYLMKIWVDLSRRMDKSYKEGQWKNKENKIFWRGGTSGKGKNQPYEFYNYKLTNIGKLPRLTLVILSKLYPDLIDAKFISHPQIAKNKDGKNLRRVLDRLFGKTIKYNKTLKEEEHLKYKYLISIDGETCAWLRVPWIMLSGSVLVKQESSKIEWFYPALKPYIHYVPVKENLSDIFTQIEWMKNNDEKMQEIAYNAHEFIKKEVMPEHLDSYMAIILDEYHKIQKDKEIKITITPTEEMGSLSILVALLTNRVYEKVLK
jgi:hypothetical protein